MYFEAILFTTRLFLWLAGIVGGVFFLRLSPRYKLITSYIFLGIGIDLLTEYFIDLFAYNLFLLPAFSFFELLIFTVLYLRFFLGKSSPSIFVFALSLFGLIFLDIVYLCDLYNAANFYALSKVVSDVGIVSFCLIYFWKVLKGLVPINKDMLLLNALFLFYFSVNFLIFGSINFLINESLQLVNPFWTLNLLSAIILYSIMTYMIWQHGSNQRILPYGS